LRSSLTTAGTTRNLLGNLLQEARFNSTNGNTQSSTARELNHIARKLAKKSISPQSLAIYDRHFKMFKNFHLKLYGSKEPLSISTKNMEKFAAHLYRKCYHANTIRAILTGIQFQAKVTDARCALNMIYIGKIIEGIKRSTTEAQKLNQITKEILRSMVDTLQLRTVDAHTLSMTRALFLLMYHGCFQIEVPSPGNSYHPKKWKVYSTRLM